MACKELEERVFSDPSVVEAVTQRFVAVRVDTTDSDNPEKHFRMDLFRSGGNPTCGFLDSEGKLVEGQVIGVDLSVDEVNPAKFIEMLKAVK